MSKLFEVLSQFRNNYGSSNNFQNSRFLNKLMEEGFQKNTFQRPRQSRFERKIRTDYMNEMYEKRSYANEAIDSFIYMSDMKDLMEKISKYGG